MSFGIVGTDVMERINWVRLRNEKKQKSLQSINEAGLGAVLVMYEENIRYTTSTHGPEWTKTIPGLRSALLLNNGEAVVYEQGDNRYHIMHHCPWLSKESILYAYPWTKGAAGPANENQNNKVLEELKGYNLSDCLITLPRIKRSKPCCQQGIACVYSVLCLVFI